MLVLKSREFRREREGSWHDLEQMVSRIDRWGVQELSTEERERLPMLYRSALSSLSVARSIALDRALVDYLDNLALRSFLAVYAQPLAVWRGILDYVTRSLPKAVRAVAPQVAIALFALTLGIISGFVLVNADEGWFSVFVPAGLAGGRGPASTKKELLEVLSTHSANGTALLAFANYLFSNNTLVSLLIFGLGFMGGVPTLLLTVGNGLVLGALLALHRHRGLLGEFAGWVSVHGVTEMAAIVLFAAAGLRLGELVLFPGRRKRADALAEFGPTIGEVAVGGVLMLVVAAFLEGVVRQTVLDTNLRLTIATVSLLFWVLYFGVVGRRRDE
jgi:uncharacterized membrane protein SpoIIM required for sporulation